MSVDPDERHCGGGGGGGGGGEIASKGVVSLTTLA